MLTWLWLPDAMEGPTPVSTLLHSATLVLVGIIVWSHDVERVSIGVLFAMSGVGWALICFGWGFESDCKKVCAVSTCIMVGVIWMEVLICADEG